MSDHNIGLNLIETNGTATVPLVGASTSTAGFIVVTERGPIDKPILVNSWVEYQNTFGNPVKDATGKDRVGVYAVKGFFENGGRQAYICRIGNGGASSSTSPVDNSEDVKKFCDEFKSLYEALNTSLPNLVTAITETNQKTDQVVQTKSTIAQLNEQIQTILKGFDLLTGDNLAQKQKDHKEAKKSLEENESKLEIEQKTLKANIDALKKSITAKNLLENKYNIFSVVEELYKKSQQIALLKKLNFTSTDKDETIQNIITVLDSAYSILNGGSYSGVDKNIEDLTGSNPKKIEAELGALTVKINALKSIIDGITFEAPPSAKTSNKTPITAGYKGSENPGTWANGKLKIKCSKKGETINNENTSLYSLQVLLNDVVVESYNDLMAEALFSQIQQNSNFIKFSSEANPQPTLDAIPNQGLTFEGGTDTRAPVLVKDPFDPFNAYSIQMLACPDFESQATINAGMTYCAERNDCVFIASLSLTSLSLTTHVVSDANTFPENLKAWDRGRSYGVLYAPWIKVYGTNKLIEIPPTGHVMGVYARISAERGIWKAPAGDEAGLRGVLGVTHQYTDAQHTTMVRQYHINCIRYIPGSGIVIDSSRTLCSDPRWWYVNVRRLFNFIKSSLKNNLGWVRQEPNRSDLWNKVKFNVVRPFMMDLWRQGAFGTGTPEQVFTIKCDADNNPPHHVDQGIFKLEVYLYPSKPAETILITVGQQDFGGSASES